MGLRPRVYGYGVREVMTSITVDCSSMFRRQVGKLCVPTGKTQAQEALSPNFKGLIDRISQVCTGFRERPWTVGQQCGMALWGDGG